jgi:RNA polymerase sigma-70 factor (ECF subfamily)
MNTAATATLLIDPVEEANWLSGVAEGDAASFRKLYQRFRGVIYSTIYKVLANREDAEDTAQEVFAQIWQKAHLFQKSRGRALTWIATMARNRAIDRLRTKQRRARLGDAFIEREAIEEKVQTRDASDDADLSERAHVVRQMMNLLTNEQREAIELVYFGGLTHAEAAQRLGHPLGTIKARVRRGLARLRSAAEADVLAA